MNGTLPDFDCLLRGDVARAAHTYRWATNRLQHRESVAEHTFFVAVYADIIADFLWNQAASEEDRHVEEITDHYEFYNDFKADVLQKALFHDLEECRTGDIHRPFKHSTPELRASLDAAANTAADQITKAIHPNTKVFADRLRSTWMHSKDGSPAGRIVCYCDFLSVVSYIMQASPHERTYLNMASFPEHRSKFDGIRYEFMRSVIQGVNRCIDASGILETTP